MKSKKQDPALQTPADANPDKDKNYFAEEDADPNNDSDKQESVESRRRRDDADSGNDESSNERLQYEKQIDPGNEHHHGGDADDHI